MSTVTVQLFASYADSFGGPFLKIHCEPGTTVGDLIRNLRVLPGADVLPVSPRVAVNRKFASTQPTRWRSFLQWQADETRSDSHQGNCAGGFDHRSTIERAGSDIALSRH